MKAKANLVSGFCVDRAAGSGSRRAISRSKRRNRIATKKNRKEKGSRAEASGSNPHSYGDSFSWSTFRTGRRWPTIDKIRERADANKR